MDLFKSLLFVGLTVLYVWAGDVLASAAIGSDVGKCESQCDLVNLDAM